MSDRTYAETTGRAPLDWNKWLDDAIEKTPDRDGLYDAVMRAREWTTCACGNQCAIIPRDEYGEPLDEELAALGSAFYACLNTASFDPELAPCKLCEAKTILGDIEARAAAVIKETLAQLNSK